MTREPYADVAALARETLRRANAIKLTSRERRVLAAVVAFTALYSRRSDRVYLAQLAAFAHGVDEAKPWMLKRTREALVRLNAEGLIVRTEPRGRPPGGSTGPAYFIALNGETDLDPGVTSETDPGTGASSDEKQTPILDRNGPRSRTESDPAPRAPTEKASEKASEGASPSERAAQLLTRSDAHLRAEVEQITTELTASHGVVAIDAAIAQLGAGTFQWPSDLRRALIRALPKNGHRPKPRTREDCERCNGSGWIEDDKRCVKPCTCANAPGRVTA